MCLSMTSYGDLCATGRCQGHGHGCNYLNLPLIPASGTQVLIFPLLLWFWNLYLYLMRQRISPLHRFLWTSAMPSCFYSGIYKVHRYINLAGIIKFDWWQVLEIFLMYVNWKKLDVWRRLLSGQASSFWWPFKIRIMSPVRHYCE